MRRQQTIHVKFFGALISLMSNFPKKPRIDLSNCEFGN